MKNLLIISAALLFGLPLSAQPAQPAQAAQAANVDFDAKHKACLEKIADDAETAYEDAMIWQSEGGGRRARHCVAMALLGLGHPGEAAFRLEKIAKAPDGGSPNMRAGFYVEAAGLWLEANEPRRAYDAATAGLKIARSDLDLRVVRARAYGALGHWDYAQTELTSAMAFHPGNALALRTRADAYFQQNNLQQAQADIEKSLEADGSNIEALLLRGKIKEALRLNLPQTIEIQK